MPRLLLIDDDEQLGPPLAAWLEVSMRWPRARSA
jgi:hypothetical protein